MEYSEEESRLQEITNEVLSARQVLRTGSKKLHWDVAYSNLAIALGNLYELTGDIDVLKETIEVSRKAMSLCSTDDPDWLERCADLASYLVDLFQLTDDGNLLDEAIELNREALTLYPIDEPDWEPTRDVFCRALAIPLEHRYSQTGDIGALEEAIELNREALALRSYGTEEWRYACDYVAKALYKRYVYARDERDIREAISLLREAMSLCPLSERNHIFAAICQDLSVSLGILFEVTADTALSDEALNLARMAMHLPYKSHHDRPDRVGLLCHQLWERYQHSQQIDLLTEMMRYSSEILTMKNAVYHDEVLVLTALAHLKEDTPYYNVSLSLSYMTRLLEIPATDSVWLWTSLLEYSDALVVPHVLQSPSAALTALKIVSSAMDVISHRAGLMLDPQHQLRNIREASKFGMNALTIATYAGNPSVGLELLEYTRGFMWSQALRIHDPKLMSLPRDMAAELSTLFKAMCHKPSLSLKSFQLDEELKRRIITEIRHRKAIQIENILKHARTLPGMENFMKGPSNIQLAELSRTCPHIVVVLAATGQHTQAFILRPSDRGAADQKHELTVVSLPLLNGKMKTLFKTLPGVTSRGTDSYKSFEDSGVSRMMRVDKHRPHMKGLETLWTDVVKPILRSLELSRVCSLCM
jgi:tetratricopeptide (TPR) repeat protein